MKGTEVQHENILFVNKGVKEEGEHILGIRLIKFSCAGSF